MIPVNVLLKVLDNVTAGFANEVEEVNQYAAPIYIPTAGAIKLVFFFFNNKIVIRRPNVAIISEMNVPTVNLSFSEILIKSISKIILVKITPEIPPKI